MRYVEGMPGHSAPSKGREEQDINPLNYKSMKEILEEMKGATLGSKRAGQTERSGLAVSETTKGIQGRLGTYFEFINAVRHFVSLPPSRTWIAC